MMEEHEEVHSGIRWRRVCAIFEDHPLWKAVNPEERKDVFEDVTFALAKKERVRMEVAGGGGRWREGGSTYRSLAKERPSFTWLIRAHSWSIEKHSVKRFAYLRVKKLHVTLYHWMALH